MAKRKVVRRYTEEQMVTLLENIVKRVKEEQRLVESSKKTRNNSLTEDFKKNGNKRPLSRRSNPNRRRS